VAATVFGFLKGSFQLRDGQSLKVPKLVGYLIKCSVNQQCGMSAANALERDFSGMEGRDECIFESVDCKPTASLRINVSHPPSCQSNSLTL
jgi:hypothetical protein